MKKKAKPKKSLKRLKKVRCNEANGTQVQERKRFIA